ncbi:universal stress protein [Actinoplanes sp. NPDC051861]|uniref:universal stress protein n=1 Tax=Actinoplanes sp. NPDC051861 TaxID=3155170 RepID=UPI003435038A
MQIPAQGPVVVGVDGTPAALTAVRLAAREAASRRRVLHIVHAFTWPDGADFTAARRAASRFVEEAVTTAQRSTPGVEARGQLVDGPPGRVLLRLSRGAVLLAIGEVMPGSPLVEVVSRAWCPVAVTHGPRPPTGPVLAALDGSAYSVLALRFAAEEAVRRGGAVHAVHVTAEGGDAAERLLDEALAAVPEILGVRVKRRIVLGSAPEALPRLSRRAGLTVLGPRGARSGVHLGTVAGEVLRRGSGPAVFVHAARSPSRRVPPPPARPAGAARR